MTDLDLDAISARLLPLAPGPWCAAPSHEIYGNPPDDDPDLWTWAVAEAGEDDPPIVETVFAGRETAAFVAAARTDVPALVAELLVLRDRITQLEAENNALQSAIAEHDDLRAELMRQHEAQRLTEWQEATAQIESLEAERYRVTELGAQWAQERDTAREQLGREMATVDDMATDLDRAQARAETAEAQLTKVRELCDQVHGHGADTLEGEMRRLRTIINQIDAIVGTTKDTQ